MASKVFKEGWAAARAVWQRTGSVPPTPPEGKKKAKAKPKPKAEEPE